MRKSLLQTSAIALLLLQVSLGIVSVRASGIQSPAYIILSLAADPACVAGEYKIWGNTTTGVIKKCANGTITIIGGITGTGTQGYTAGFDSTSSVAGTPIILADQMPGADACAKIDASRALISTGGVVDARGFIGAQACATSPYTTATTGPITLVLGKATFTTDASWRPFPGDQIIGVGTGTVIKAAASFSPAHLINGQINSAANILIQDLVLDGNRANDPSGTSLLIFDGGSNNTVRGVTFQNSPGHGLYVQDTSTGNTIERNTFTNIKANPIYIVGSTASSGYNRVVGNRVDSWGVFGIATTFVGNNTIEGNFLNGTQVLANVDTTNAANSVVTCNSCTSFGPLAIGMSVQIGTFRHEITVVTSTAQVTVNGNFGALTNQAAVAGSLEPINLNSSSNNRIANNDVQKSADAGIVLHADGGGPTDYNTVVGNTVQLTAVQGISLDASGGSVSGNLISGNTVFNSRQYSNPTSQADVGIRVGSVAATNNFVSGNSTIDDQGSPTQQYGVAFDTVGAGNAMGPSFFNGNAAGPVRGASNATGTAQMAGVLNLSEANLTLPAAAGGTATATNNDVLNTTTGKRHTWDPLAAADTTLATTGDLVTCAEDQIAVWITSAFVCKTLPNGGVSYNTSTNALSQISAAATIGITIDGGGSAIATGVKGFVRIPFACTIADWYLLADQSGSIVIDVWKDTYANFPPTVLDTIAGSEKPTLSAVQLNRDTALGTWTTAVAADDILAFNVDSAATVTRVNLTIKCTRSL